jgi:rhodanese-related sulfurtransferase
MKFLASLCLALALVSCTSTVPESVVSEASVVESKEEKKVSSVAADDEADNYDKSLITGVEVERVFELRESGKSYIIDTRPPLFYMRGSIQGSNNLPLKHFDKEFPNYESAIKSAASDGKVIVIYCASEKCPDSYLMAKKFAQMGIPSSVFKGGWRLWKQTGLE